MGNNKRMQGIALAVATAVISGFSIFYNKQVLIRGVDPSTLNIIKNGGTAVILTLLILLSANRRKALASTNPKGWMRLIILGIIGGGIPFALYFQGLTMTSAATAGIIHKTMFLWVAAMAIPFLGEQLSIPQMAGYLLVAGSNFLIGGFSGFTGSPGEMMILAATILWAVENIIAKITLSDSDALTAAWGRMFFGVLVIAGIALAQNKLWLIARLTPDQAFPVFTSIVLLSGYVITWYKALSKAPATIVSAILILSTPVTTILSGLAISQPLPAGQIAGTVATVVGILIVMLLPRITKTGNSPSAI